jgi:hypothetical protein
MLLPLMMKVVMLMGAAVVVIDVLDWVESAM